MNIEKMRGEFESAIRNGDFLNDATDAAKDMILERNHNGAYRSLRIRDVWWAWQASRAAIEVELPEMIEAYGGNGYHAGDPDDAYLASDIVEAIESLGLKIK